MREQHQAGNEKLVNKDDRVSERGKNFRNPLKTARGWKRQEMNEHQVERERVWNTGTEFSLTGEVSQAAHPQDKHTVPQPELQESDVAWEDALCGAGQHCGPWP